MDKIKNEISKIIHELVNTIRILNGESELKDFKDLPENEKKNLYDNIDYILQHPNLTPKQEHEIWCRLKKEDGWKCGPTDRENKVHECLVEYDDLNDYQKLKDAVIINVVKIFYNL